MAEKTRVLVTGASGFIGHHLVKYLRSKGYWVRGADLYESKYMSKNNYNEYWNMDLRSQHNCRFVTQDMEIVYNLAALNGSIEFTTNNKAELMRNNALININMAESCWLARVKKVFYASSACVYPMNLQDTDIPHPLKESDAYPANCDTEYGWEKLFSERVYQSYAKDHGMNIRIARFINIYGTECLIDTLKSKAPLALTRKVIEAGNGGSVEIWGDGKQKRTFCYIDDLLEGIELLMNSNITDPVNIGSDELMSINELVDMISDIESINVIKVHDLNKVQGVRTRTPDLSMINSLGWKRKVSMKDGLTAVNKFVHKELNK